MRKIFFIILLPAFIISGCTNDHFITDRDYRNKVEAQFEKQKELAKNRSSQLIGVFESNLSTREKEALKFLYAYSPLSDLADYGGEFFLQNIRSSFAARDTFQWGKTVPENLFRHFVLPIRVNNENLDSSRWIFFNELKDRIKGLPMKEAVLEVNHWCHEKVTYRGSDSRTSSPLSTVRTAWGRCGEESTFTVAALRSVCIPARQCYTPRWAHTDDNHAWVEVWVDGKWHFIGACEPDADLDLAWFTKPAKRAMLVNTTVFGDYEGPEDVLQKDPLFTKINILENYAPVKRVAVKVTDEQNNTVDSAAVEFQLYNYAEFYPLYKTVTDKNGYCSFQTGFGDLLVWAAKGPKYGFNKLDVRTTDTLAVKLDRKPGQSFVADLDMVPPAEAEISDHVSDLARKQNNGRLSFEDGLRGSYEATFIDSLKTSRFARLVSLNPDTLWYFMQKSAGNWRQFTSFIPQVPTGRRPLIFPLLKNISEKDLRDIDSTVLSDNLNWSMNIASLVPDKEDFYRYVLSPRVDNEFLKPYKHFFQLNFNREFVDGARIDPSKIAGWLRANIALNSTANYSRAPLTPMGVYELKVADAHSIDICFVAICRSFGIPARLEPATKIPQYKLNGQWVDVYIVDKKSSQGDKASLILQSPGANEKKPGYSIQFTLEQYRDGFFRTLDYEGSPLVQNFPCTLDIPVGPCLMVTGNRLPDGTVLSKLSVFEIKKGSALSEPVALRENLMSLPAYGRVDMSKFQGNFPYGMVVAWIDPGKEPTRHFLADLGSGKKEFSSWKGRIVLVFPSEEQMKSFENAGHSQLPGNITSSFQPAFQLSLKDIGTKAGELKNLPVVICLDEKGVINYLSEGYRIGTGNELLTILKK